MSTGQNIPDDVRRFILTSIPSVPHLEALLLLRNESAVGWDAKDVARRLYLNEKSAETLLSELHAAGMLGCEQAETPRYSYSPDEEDLCEIISRLANVYARHLVEVTHLIHSTTSKKAQYFADAFKWRKES